jgi:hypothetical protein
MSRLEQPFVGRVLRSTGDTVIQAELALGLRTRANVYVAARFVVDTGTEMTTMPAYTARALDLPKPSRPVPGLYLDGQDARSGLLRARIIGLDPTEYVFPCYFVGDPLRPPTQSTNLLGLTGVADQVRLCFDGKSVAGAQYGR